MRRNVDARLRGFSQREFRSLHRSGEIRRSEECRQRESAGEKAEFHPAKFPKYAVNEQRLPVSAFTNL